MVGFLFIIVFFGIIKKTLGKNKIYVLGGKAEQVDEKWRVGELVSRVKTRAKSLTNCCTTNS